MRLLSQMYLLLFIHVKSRLCIAQSLSSSRDFRRSKETKVYAYDGSANDNYGSSLDIWENISVIGAFATDIGGVLTGAAYIYRINETGWNLESKVVGNNQSHDFFGWSVAVHNNIVIVGAYMALGDPISVGAAYIFVPTGDGSWSRQADLRAWNGKGNEPFYDPDYDYFGWSVELYENVALVGAYGDDERGSFSGSVYVFERITGAESVQWSQRSKLIPSEGATFDSFGWCLAMYENTAIIGAYGDTNAYNTYVGSAYIFENTNYGWSQNTKLYPPDGAEHDFFGWSVGLWDSNVVVGAHWSSVDSSATGAAYIFVRDFLGAWTFQSKLVAGDPDKSLYFGYSVSIYSNIVAVSAFGDSYHAVDVGAVYLFHSSADVENPQWLQEACLTPNSSTGYDDFGVAVAVWGEVILVGAKRAEGVAVDSGVAYAFSRADVVNSQPTYFPVDSSTFVALVAYLPIAFCGLLAVAVVLILTIQPKKSNNSTGDVQFRNVSEESSVSLRDLSDTSQHSLNALMP